MYTIGIDSGSVATKAVLFDGSNNRLIDHITIPTGWSPKKAAEQALELIRSKAGIQQTRAFIVVTGYGRVSIDFADKIVSEITCHAKGAFWLDKDVRTIIDIGGQDSKAISINPDGNVTDFLMNDKCAAGTGRFLQISINSLGEDIENLDKLTAGTEPQIINSMCTVFAESEVISLLANGCAKESIALGLVHSIAGRTITLVSKLKITDKILFTGGLAKSTIIKSILAEKLSAEIHSSQYSQLAGAIGAAVIGWNHHTNGKLKNDLSE